ncbi:MAG: SEL1-like repeat protein [Elusimicrobia bacterium]|nr:SEL1-like repeat protein [Elusimicrobiota bacterium]
MAQAQRSYGMLYRLGNGVGLDLEKAAVWYAKAAAQGDAPAQNELCTMLLEGKGVDQDFVKALAMCRKAAVNGEMDSQYRMGLMYHQGYGTAIDPKTAAVWYRRAAERNQPEAQANLGVLYLTGSGVAKDEKAAAEWLTKAAEWGNIPAQATLAGMYLEGTGVVKNETEAAVLYRKAAEGGIASAQSMLGWMLQTGTGVPQDAAEALAWYRKAAEQGDETAKVNLASLSAEAPQAPAQPAPAPKTISSDVDAPGYALPENPASFAVVVGVERYASLPAAEFAERDAEAVRAHLMALGTPARNIYFLSGPLATRAKLAQALNTWLPNRVKEDSTVFFFYSGHGAPDPASGQAYLVPADGDPEDLDSTAYPLRELYARLGKLKARSVVVALDSCFSGAGGRSVIAKGTRPLVVSVEAAELPERVVALTASDKNQVSGTLDEQGHGAFTYYLLKGLSGAAKNEGGHVTVQSLHGYLTPKVQDAARLKNRDQTPQLLPAAAPAVRIR